MPPSIALALAAGLAATGICSRPADRTTAPATSTGARMATDLEHLLTQQSSGYRTATESTIRDAAGWRAAWRTLHAGDTTVALPAVDFTRDMVVLVALGEITTGGHSVGVESVAAEGSGGVVRYTVSVPGPRCRTTQALSSPVDVVRAPRVAGTVRFERKTVREDC